LLELQCPDRSHLELLREATRPGASWSMAAKARPRL